MERKWQVMGPNGSTWGMYAGNTPREAVEASVAGHPEFSGWIDFAEACSLDPDNFRVIGSKVLLRKLEV